MKLKRILFSALLALVATSFVGCKDDGGEDKPGGGTTTDLFTIYAKTPVITSEKVTIDVTSPGGEGKHATKAYFVFKPAADEAVAAILKKTGDARNAAMADYAKANGTLVTLPYNVSQDKLTPETKYVIGVVGYDEATSAFNTAGKVVEITTGAAGLGEVSLEQVNIWSYGYEFKIGSADPSIHRVAYIQRPFSGTLYNEKSAISIKLKEIFDTTEGDEPARLAKLKEAITDNEYGVSLFPAVYPSTSAALPVQLKIGDEASGAKVGDEWIVITVGISDNAAFEPTEIKQEDGTFKTFNLFKGELLTDVKYKIFKAEKNAIDEPDIEYSTATINKVEVVEGSVELDAAEEFLNFDLKFTGSDNAAKVKYTIQGWEFTENDAALYRMFEPEDFEPVGTFASGSYVAKIDGYEAGKFYIAAVAFDADGKQSKPFKGTFTLTKPVKADMTLETTITSRFVAGDEATHTSSEVHLSAKLTKAGAGVAKWAAFAWGADSTDDDIAERLANSFNLKKFVDVSQTEITDFTGFNYLTEEINPEVLVVTCAMTADGTPVVVSKKIYKYSDGVVLDPLSIKSATVTPTETNFNVDIDQFGSGVKYWMVFCNRDGLTDDKVLEQNAWNPMNMRNYTPVATKSLTVEFKETDTTLPIVILVTDGKDVKIAAKMNAKKKEAGALLATAANITIVDMMGDGDGYAKFNADLTFTAGGKQIKVYATATPGLTTWDAVQGEADTVGDAAIVQTIDIAATDTTKKFDFKVWLSSSHYLYVAIVDQAGKVGEVVPFVFTSR